MTIQNVLFIILVFTTFLGTGVQVYIDREVYPLFAFVGKGELQGYLKAFEQRLVVPLMLPFLIGAVSNIALFFIRPDNVSLPVLIVVLVLGVITAIVTAVVATPIYNRYKQKGESNSQELRSLQQVNLLRLALSIATSGCVIYLLLQALTA